MTVIRQATPWLLALLLAAALVAGCSSDGGAEAGTERSRSAEASGSDGTDGAEEERDERVPVEVAILERGPIESVLRFSTNLEAESDVEVYSQAARRVTELLVEEGDRVRAGELLLRLQDEEQRAELRRVESQLAKARREYERQQNLFARELISEQAMNDATYEVEQLEIALEDARRNLSYTEVRAPIGGTVTARYVNVGDQVTVNEHLFDIVDFDTIVARVFVPERELDRLAVGQAARLFSDSLGGGDHTGEVIRIAPIVDPRSGTVKVTVGIPRNQGLLPGMYVEVELVTAVHEDALLLPKRAVVYDENRAFVFRVTGDDRAERVEVEVALEDAEQVEPAPGAPLEVGDAIVVAGQAGLKDGAPVRRATGRSAAVEEPETGTAEGKAPEAGAPGTETPDDGAAAGDGR